MTLGIFDTDWHIPAARRGVPAHTGLVHDLRPLAPLHRSSVSVPYGCG